MSDVMPYGAMPPEPEVEDKVEPEVVVEPEVEPEKPEEPDYKKSYAELQKKFGEHSNLVGQLRKQNEELSKKMAELEKSSVQREEKAREQPPPTDYEKMLRDVAKKYEDGDISYEQSLLETNRITREMTKAEAEAEKAALIQQARAEVQNLLAEKDTEAVVSKFHEKNPDFQTLRDAGTFEELKAEDPLLDDLSAYWKYQANQRQAEIEAAFEKGKQEALRVKAGSEKAGKVLADPGTSMQNQQKPNRPLSEAELKASMLAQIK